MGETCVEISTFKIVHFDNVIAEYYRNKFKESRLNILSIQGHKKT